MFLIVGLGNPEKKYNNTYHNIGFMALDFLAQKLGFEFNKKQCKAITAEGFYNGEKLVLAKPQTYMNRSGLSLSELVKKFKIPLENIIVVLDDIDLLVMINSGCLFRVSKLFVTSKVFIH